MLALLLWAEDAANGGGGATPPNPFFNPLTIMLGLFFLKSI